jgi:sulfur carrier protein
MEITVNGEDRAFSGESMTVVELLGQLEIEQFEGLAVAVDERVVPKSRWSDTQVGDGASVEVIRAAQGG